MKKAILRFAGILVATALISIDLMAPKAMAYNISVSASIVSAKCVTGIFWQGKAKPADGHWPGYIPTQPNGRVKICATKLKLRDKDKKADYYAVDVQMTVTYSKSHKAAVKKGASSFFGQSPFILVASSSKPAVDKVYSATPSIRRKLGSVNVSASFGLGPFSISASSKFNAFTAVTRSRVTKQQAEWRGSEIADIKKLSVIYAQKVSTKPSSKAPKMVVNVGVPQVIYRWTKQLASAHGYAYYAYVPGSPITTVRGVSIVL